MARVLLNLPRRFDDLAARLEQGRLEVRMPELKVHVARLERGVRKLIGAIIFAAVLVAGTQLFIAGHRDLAIGMFAVEVAVLAWIIFWK